MCTCECGNEPSGSIKCGEFLDQLRYSQLVKKDSAPWSQFLVWLVSQLTFEGSFCSTKIPSKSKYITGFLPGDQLKQPLTFLCFVDRASLYNLFRMKPTRCTLLLSIFISTSLHVSGNYLYVPIIRRTYCIYATLVFSLCMGGCLVCRPESKFSL